MQSMRHVQKAAKEIRYDPLPDEVRTVVIAAWSRGGLLPRLAIEQTVPAEVSHQRQAN